MASLAAKDSQADRLALSLLFAPLALRVTSGQHVCVICVIKGGENRTNWPLSASDDVPNAFISERICFGRVWLFENSLSLIFYSVLSFLRNMD